MTRNQKMIELTGYLPEHQHGLSWWLSLVHPEDRELVTDTLKEVTDKSLQSWQADYRFLCADGEYKEMHDRGFVIHHNGMPVKMIGSLHDVTDRKLMQTLLLEERLHQYRIISENTLRVQEQERSRFGRELHDNVNQILSAIRLYVGMLTPANVEEKEIKQKVIEYSLLAIEEIRKLSREMITPQLDDGLLVDNIKRIITDVEMTSGIKVKFTYDQDIGLLSPGKKLALFRIIQEQVRNIIKYSKATQVEILLQCSHEIALLIIKDNGVGFDFKKIKSGVGLLSMLERAKFYNGVTEIQSAPGNGTTVITRIPVIKNSTASLNKKMPL
jgi:PAS domain S-box-containing protein